MAVLDREIGARGRLRAVRPAELGERAREGLRGFGQDHLVLRPLGAGERRLDGAEIERQQIGELGIGRVRVAPETLRLRIGLDQRDPFRVATGEPEIGAGLRVDREEAAGGTVFRRHVGDGRPVGQRKLVEAGAAELHELADHAPRAQHLGNREHQVGRGHPLAQPALEPEADHLGQQHRDRLAEHRRLRFDAAHAPAQHRQAVDHRGVAVGADQGVGIGQRAAAVVAGPDGLGEVFEIDLVTDSGAGRNDAEIAERLGAPVKEGVAFLVALELALDIGDKRIARTEAVHHHRVVDHQVDGRQRVDLLRIAAQIGHRLAHGGQVDDRGYAGEVLQQGARGVEGDLVGRRAGLQPGGRRPRCPRP